MRTLAVDIETYSDRDLPKCGMYAYVESQQFEILLLAYAWDEEPVQVVDIARCQRVPAAVRAALVDPAVLKTAFNAPFERTCLAKWCNEPMPAEQWACTSVLARELGLPGSLDGVSGALKLPEDKAKLSSGRALIRFFCKPNKRGDLMVRNRPEGDPERWALFVEYNRQDVEAEREVRRLLGKFSVHPDERALWLADQAINDRGVRIDGEFVRAASRIGAAAKEDTLAKARVLTGLENPASAVQLKEWIRATSGAQVDSLKKDRLAEVREAADNEDVDAMLDLRGGLSKSSTAKYDTMLRAVCADGRVRGLTQFYGASRTGRWAGRLVQLQNLPRNLMPDCDLDAARRLVRSGNADGLSMLFDDTAGTLSELIRTSFIPRPGCRFVVADFSAIEARVIAWLAGEKWRMEVFNTHGKIYEASAEQMFHLPPGSVKKGDAMRQRGKVAELALGYGGSVGALMAMGALHEGLAEEELLPLVKAWRKASPAIVSWWWAVDAACRKTITTKQATDIGHGMQFRAEGPLLRLRLPSGRELSYVRPAVVDDKITYYGSNQTSGKWCKIDTYGPKLVENIVQAVARDCLAEALLRVEAAGLPVVFHVHDELIAEAPDGWRSADGATTEQAITALLGVRPAWAAELPLRADAYSCDYYRKD